MNNHSPSSSRATAALSIVSELKTISPASPTAVKPHVITSSVLNLSSLTILNVRSDFAERDRLRFRLQTQIRKVLDKFRAGVISLGRKKMETATPREEARRSEFECVRAEIGGWGLSFNPGWDLVWVHLHLHTLVWLYDLRCYCLRLLLRCEPLPTIHVNAAFEFPSCSQKSGCNSSASYSEAI